MSQTYLFYYEISDQFYSATKTFYLLWQNWYNDKNDKLVRNLTLQTCINIKVTETIFLYHNNKVQKVSFVPKKFICSGSQILTKADIALARICGTTKRITMYQTFFVICWVDLVTKHPYLFCHFKIIPFNSV